MKKTVYCLLLLGFLHYNLQAQKIKMRAIPYLLHFENAPLNYKVTSDNSIRISAPANSDLFISPDGEYKINKSPRLVFQPDSDFIFSAKINLEFKSKWDAGVLLIYNDDKHFAKFCFESDFQGKPRVVSVVCNEVADDCNSMVIHKNAIYYRIIGSTRNSTFSFYYSSDGKSWFPIRTFKLCKTDNVQIGFSVQSPTGKECVVDFTNIDLQQRKLLDIWTGN